MPQLTLHSPVGELTISEEAGAIVALDWGRGPPDFQRETPLLVQTKTILEKYFDGVFEPIDLPLAPAGSAFRQRVWQAMQAIPVGETQSYGALARAIGSAPRSTCLTPSVRPWSMVGIKTVANGASAGLHNVPGLHHGADNLVVAGAPAQVARQPKADSLFVWVRLLVQETFGGHDEPWGADTAL